MGSTNYGNQTITFNYQQEATASGFNGLLYKIIPTGIIEGGECSIDTNNNTITVSPMNVILNGVDALGNDSELVIHVTTENNITSLSPDNATPYVVARFNWEEADNNYMDVICVSSPYPNDIIFCKCEFDGGTLIGIDYTKRTWSYIHYAKEFLNYDDTNGYMHTDFNVIPNNTQGFYVSYGKAIIGGKYVEVQGSPYSFTNDPTSNLYFETPTQGRCDLVVVTAQGNILYIMGTDDGNYVVPRCPISCIPLAKITIDVDSVTPVDWIIKGSMIENYNIVNYTGVSPVIGNVEYDGGTPKKGTLYAHTLYI